MSKSTQKISDTLTFWFSVANSYTTKVSWLHSLVANLFTTFQKYIL